MTEVEQLKAEIAALRELLRIKDETIEALKTVRRIDRVRELEPCRPYKPTPGDAPITPWWPRPIYPGDVTPAYPWPMHPYIVWSDNTESVTVK